MMDCVYLIAACIFGGIVGFFICAFFVGANQHRFEQHGGQVVSRSRAARGQEIVCSTLIAIVVKYNQKKREGGRMP